MSAYLAVNNPRLINNFHFQSGDQAKPLPVANAALWSSILVRALPALPALTAWSVCDQAPCSMHNSGASFPAQDAEVSD